MELRREDRPCRREGPGSGKSTPLFLGLHSLALHSLPGSPSLTPSLPPSAGNGSRRPRPRRGEEPARAEGRGKGEGGRPLPVEDLVRPPRLPRQAELREGVALEDGRAPRAPRPGAPLRPAPPVVPAAARGVPAEREVPLLAQRAEHRPLGVERVRRVHGVLLLGVLWREDVEVVVLLGLPALVVEAKPVHRDGLAGLHHQVHREEAGRGRVAALKRADPAAVEAAPVPGQQPVRGADDPRGEVEDADVAPGFLERLHKAVVEMRPGARHDDCDRLLEREAPLVNVVGDAIFPGPPRVDEPEGGPQADVALVPVVVEPRGSLVDPEHDVVRVYGRPKA
uniref:Uncharacterized protein n=1 Tax=Tetraselmis sp. GSL018 TaxID=582737 RepID=A0A061SIP6_9CHLO|mmetsp:Transcript_26402/g.62711  ORF Transcript_26402/g.62711 Transcript_26402/m.62711 type:complete len:338 (-) Transcript_26402:636-1649(-)